MVERKEMVVTLGIVETLIIIIRLEWRYSRESIV